MKIIHGLIQGTPAWKAHRATHYNASEAAAMLGLDKKTSRSELLRMYALGHEKEFSDYVQKHVLDKGHEVEALARPIIEEMLGEDLSPLIGVDDQDEMLSASFDGITFDFSDTCFEHKQWNDELAESVSNGIVPDTHMPQPQQQLMISGAMRCIFVVSDGTKDKMVWCDVLPDPSWFERIRAGWAQFHKDRENYKHNPVDEMPPAQDVSIDLPALVVYENNQITDKHFDSFDVALKKTLAAIKSIALKTDQDFSNAKESAKLLRDRAKEVEKALEDGSLGEIKRRMDGWKKTMNETALYLEKKVEAEDLAKKAAMIDAATLAYRAHVDALEAETLPIQLTVKKPDFALAIKGKRSYQNMQDAIDAALANGKIEADAIARDIRAKLDWCKENAAGKGALFPDLPQIISKPMEDFTLTITSRIEKSKADEAARLEAQRQQIEAEAKAKAEAEAAATIAAAEREAAAKLAAETARIRAEEQAKAKAEAQAAVEQNNNEKAAGDATAGTQPAEASQTKPAVPVTRPNRQAMIKVVAFEFGVELNIAEEWLRAEFSEVTA